MKKHAMPSTVSATEARVHFLARRLALAESYDSHYLVVAESSHAELWTLDRRLVRSVTSELPWVHWAGAPRA